MIFPEDAPVNTIIDEMVEMYSRIYEIDPVDSLSRLSIVMHATEHYLEIARLHFLRENQDHSNQNSYGYMGMLVANWLLKSSGEDTINACDQFGINFTSTLNEYMRAHDGKQNAPTSPSLN